MGMCKRNVPAKFEAMEKNTNDLTKAERALGYNACGKYTAMCKGQI